MKTKKQMGDRLKRVGRWAAFPAILFGFAFTMQTVMAACPDPANYEMIAGVCFPKNTGLSSTPVATIIMNVMNWLLAVLGFIAVMGFVISGVQYLMSAGDDDIISTAKRNMKYSIIGVVVALSGRVLIVAINNLLNAAAPTF